MSPDAPPSTADLTDQELIGLYRQGHEELFAVLVGRYRQELFHFLARFVNDAAAADDLFQETFLQVHLSLDSFDIDRPFRPWLFTIGSNKARDYLRRRQQKSMVPLSASRSSGDGQRGLIDLLRDDLPLPTERAEEVELQEQVRQAVASLPDHLREILLLAYFHQFPYKQIAAMLEVPLGTVKSRLHAAVATFAEMWRHQHPPEDPEA